MKFIIGLLSGVVIGAVGAVVYAGRSGTDLREAYESVRSDLSKGDLDQLGSRVESAVAQMQKSLDVQIADVKARVEAVTAGRRDALDDAVDVATDAAEQAVETAKEAGEAAADAATEAVEAAKDTAEQQGA